MTEKQHVAATIDRVQRARGEESDADWARRAAGTLLWDEVLEQRIAEALDRAADQIGATGEPPYDLFGPPDEWARETQRQWRESGVEHQAPQHLSARDVVIETLIIAALFALLFFGNALITWSWDTPFTLSRALAPLALAATCRAVNAAYTSSTSRRSHTTGVVLAVLVGGLGTALTVGTFAVANDIGIGVPAVLGALGTTLAYALLGAAFAWPAGRVRDVGTAGHRGGPPR